MNRAARQRFDQFFDDRYLAVVAELEAHQPGHGRRRARSSFATAYRLWAKVELDRDPDAWIRRDAAQHRSAIKSRDVCLAADAPAIISKDDLVSERRLVIRTAHWRRGGSAAILITAAAGMVFVELYATHH